MTKEEIQNSIKKGDKRKCNKCNELLPVSEFHIKKSKNPNHYRFNSPCKFCANINRNINYQKEYQRVKKYGITQDDYNEMLKKQNYSCEICGIHKDDYSRDFSIDHCHITGKIRNLLCSNCNTMIGMSKESIKILSSAIKYINKHK